MTQTCRKNITALLTTLFVYCYALNITYGQYPLLVLPNDYRSPSGEPGQILISGVVKKVSFFHGHNDDEADWHLYINLNTKAISDFKAYCINISELYSELMVLDYYTSSVWDDKYYSADVSKSFLLSKPGSTKPAWDLSKIGVDDQGDNHNLSSYSSLDGGVAYLQGAFVNDAEHGLKPEIHPLDAVAFALDPTGKVYAVKSGDTAWPKNVIHWRVSFFMNSKIHRINGECYMKKNRTTTYYLDLPSDADKLTTTIEVKEERQQLIDQAPGRGNLFSGRGWERYPTYSIVRDPVTGKRKLKITAIMKQADNHGGIVVCDYKVIVRQLNIQPVIAVPITN